ncbi:MAG: hypothetical protein R2754_15770 [Microthrixaceae bacterium]
MAADRKPRKMLIGSIIIMVLATIGGIAAFAIGISQVANVVDKLSNTDQTTVPGTASVDGTGAAFSIWSSGSSVLNCLVATAEGTPVTLDSSNASGSSSADVNGESFDIVGEFETKSGTRYDVTCNEPAGGAFLVTDVAISDFIGFAALIVGSVVGGLGLFFVGLIFFIIALFRRSSWKKSNTFSGPQGGYQQAPAWTPPAPGGQTAWNQGGPPPPGGTGGPPPTGGGFGGPPPAPGGPPPAPGGTGGPPSPPSTG